MRRIRETAKRLATLAGAVAEFYADLDDAAHSAGSGDGIAAGRSGFRVSDPTGDVAVSGLHQHLRSKLRHASSRMKSIERPLEDAERILAEAFAAYDPEHRQRLGRLRELEQTAKGYSNPA